VPEIGRVRIAVNRTSTSATRLWCRSGLRRVLTGYGPTARQWRDARRLRPGPDVSLSAAQAEQMTARAAAIDDLLRRDPDDAGQ
jgi:hypothetical protein